MLTAPAHSFPIFHRHLQTMELLIFGVVTTREKLFVSACSIGHVIQFDYPVNIQETIDEAVRNILFLAHKRLYEEFDKEKLFLMEEGGYVH